MTKGITNRIDGLTVGIEMKNVKNISVHRHQGILEILYVLKGTIETRMSFDYYVLHEGEFAIVNQTDFHSLKGIEEENIVASIYIDLKYFEKHFKNINYITFISDFYGVNEDYPAQVRIVRNIISRILNELQLKNDGYIEKINCYLMELVGTLVNDFNEVTFYNKNIKPNSIKIDRYYQIMKYLYEKFKTKDLLEDISSNEFLCKSYLSHLFKDVVTFSFQDIVCLVRTCKSEELLLTTKMSISEISAECGYSDPKYYYKHFKKWYHCTPAEFRNMYQNELGQKSNYTDVDIDTAALLAKKYFDTTIADSKFDENSIPNIINVLTKTADSECALIFIPSETFELTDFVERINSFKSLGLKPCICIKYKDEMQNSWEKIIEKCITAFGNGEVENWNYWIFYHDEKKINDVKDFIQGVKKELKDTQLMTIFMPQNTLC